MVGTGAGSPLSQARGLPLALVGPVELLPELMAEAGVDTVLFALPDPIGEAEAAAIESCLASPADVYAVPTNFPAAQGHTLHPRELAGGVILGHVRRRPAWVPVLPPLRWAQRPRRAATSRR
jgi:hypothetical protein